MLGDLRTLLAELCGDTELLGGRTVLQVDVPILEVLDSLAVVEFQADLCRRLQVKDLPTTAVLDHPTLGEVASLAVLSCSRSRLDRATSKSEDDIDESSRRQRAMCAVDDMISGVDGGLHG